MDLIQQARQFSAVFLLLALLFGGIAAGVIPPPATGVLTGAVKDARVSGGHIESATWSYNPYTGDWHFEIIAGASAYQMVISFPQQKVEGADGAYRVDPYTLTVDLSRLYYAVPMQEDPSRTVYRYEFIDCGRYDLPDMVLQDIVVQVLGMVLIGPIGYHASLQFADALKSSAYRKAYLEAYDACRRTVDSHVAGLRAEDAYGVVLLSTDRVKKDVSVFGFKLRTLELEVPHFYGVVRYAVDTWAPKVSGTLYPVGEVGVSITGKNGSASTSLVLRDTSVPGSEGAVTASARLPVGDGYIRYVGYIASTGDVYHLPDPWVLNYDGRYVVVSSSDLGYYYRAIKRIDKYLSYGTAGDYVIESVSSLRSFLERVQGGGLVKAYAEESREVREELRRTVSSAESALSSAVKESPWDEYVVEKDVVSYGLLKLKPPAGSPAFKLFLAGDVSAEWIGLKPLPAKGKVVDVPRSPVPVSRDGGVSFTFTVKNVGESDGAFDWTVSCEGYGTLASGTTSVVPVGATVTVPVHGYLSGVRSLSREESIRCTVTVNNLFGDYRDTAAVYLHYRPDVVCHYSVPTCGEKDGVEGYFYCTSPYSPAEFRPCPEEHVCEMTPQGAKCVKRAGEDSPDGSGSGGGSPAPSSTFCRDGKVCRIVDGNTVCEPCPEGEVCKYVEGVGAVCSGEQQPVPLPPPPEGIRIVPAEGAAELWRIGAAVAALGSLLIWVALA